MHVLVVYGSKMGGTAGLANLLAGDLAALGVDVDVAEASAATRIADSDAVIVGGALYMNRWHRSARRFVKRNTRELRAQPVFFFSSGPLDAHSASEGLPPTHQVQRLIERVGAVEHITFGGCLLADASGFPARAMAHQKAGDWRDPAAVNAWAAHIVDVLRRVATV